MRPPRAPIVMGKGTFPSPDCCPEGTCWVYPLGVAGSVAELVRGGPQSLVRGWSKCPWQSPLEQREKSLTSPPGKQRLEYLRQLSGLPPSLPELSRRG